MGFTLEKPGPMQSYMCSLDIFGKNDYPLMELALSLPIRVQRIQYPKTREFYTITNKKKCLCC